MEKRNSMADDKNLPDYTDNICGGEGGMKTILIVEDEEEDARQLELVAKISG